MGLQLILVLVVGTAIGVVLARTRLHQEAKGIVNNILTLTILAIITMVGARAGYVTRSGVASINPLYLSTAIVLVAMALSLLASMIVVKVLRK
ncbi:MAG: hypothetical protein GSR86_01135 [Desulfurococcales archaeon]|nr:hypothetical protein [Desulfurococcales archaeon]